MREKLIGLTYIVIGAAMVGVCLLLAFDALAREGAATAEKDAVEKVLRDQVEAWNRGDLDAFMAGYRRSDDLSFFSGDAVHEGWEATRQRYRNRYQKGSQDMGQLSFSKLTIELAGADTAWVRGRYYLAKEKTAQQGLFTLLLRRTPAGWRIVHDHTSS